ncbi:MBOAT family protein, partial [Sulfurimonas sp. C5]|nr:MBOAT family protein [Sulfurimonas sp. C5]
VSFGRVFEHINGKDKTLYFIIGAFFFILWFKNSSFFTNNFKPTYRNVFFLCIMFFTATSMMSTVSEFLYFNF